MANNNCSVSWKISQTAEGWSWSICRKCPTTHKSRHWKKRMCWLGPNRVKQAQKAQHLGFSSSSNRTHGTRQSLLSWTSSKTNSHQCSCEWETCSSSARQWSPVPRLGGASFHKLAQMYAWMRVHRLPRLLMDDCNLPLVDLDESTWFQAITGCLVAPDSELSCTAGKRRALPCHLLRKDAATHQGRYDPVETVETARGAGKDPTPVS